jgi:hypothetical protein
MKKQLLFGVAAFAFLASSAQNPAGKKVMMPAKSSLKAYRYEKLRPGTPEVIDDSYKNGKIAGTKGVKTSTASKVSGVNAVTQSIIGHTWYDLQSNSSVGDRIYVNADGSIAACWTMEPDLGSGDPGTAYTNRGTGYNYFDGSTWGAEPTARIEPIKCGWGNIVNTGTGKEAVVSHNGASGLQQSIRGTKGTGAWASSLAFGSPAGGVVTWPRMVGTTTGDTLYNIAVANGTALGQDIPVVFSRSTDGGASWDITNVVPTGLDASKFLGFGGDSYAIAAHGSTVAIVAGGLDADVALVKSTDGGVTWTTSRTIYQFPMPLYDSSTGISDIDSDGLQDTVLTNDGIFSIALDNNNMAHVFFGRTYMTGDGTGTFLFYGVDGLVYWNETMPDGVANLDPDILSSSAILVAGVEDLNGNNTIDVGNPPVAAASGFGQYRGSLTSYPSCTFDAQNNLYLSYASVNDTLRSYADADKNVRHIYVTKRLANAINPDDFCTPIELDLYNPLQQNITEGMYASMAKRVDGNVHLVYMRDLAPGHGVPPSSGTNQDQAENHNAASEIIYAKIPVGDISNCPIPTSIKNESSSIANLNFYPNPASNNATIDVVLNETSKLDIAILNTVGQTIYSTSVNGNAGNNKIDVNLSNLSSGLYFYQVKVGNSKAVTKKFAVEK